jgi:hypothetical protein
VNAYTQTTRKLNKVITPAPEEWAREQLKNAPQRSARWAREVAAIYGLEIRDSD